ncbi:hypothetical protein V6U77_29320 [Micromonospora sp. CPCC 205546]|uniref:hypothetical protein n=1 Tax=Micromonospora sp. CPCC 205546 TaxID=3122397 RepID=UPI002FF1806D
MAGSRPPAPANPTHNRPPNVEHTPQFAKRALQNSRTHGGLADTAWEPAAVYRHLDRLSGIAQRAGIEIVRVGTGDIRADALDPEHRFASMPLFTLGPNGERGCLANGVSGDLG